MNGEKKKKQKFKKKKRTQSSSDDVEFIRLKNDSKKRDYEYEIKLHAESKKEAKILKKAY